MPKSSSSPSPTITPMNMNSNPNPNSTSNPSASLLKPLTLTPPPPHPSSADDDFLHTFSIDDDDDEPEVLIETDGNSHYPFSSLLEETDPPDSLIGTERKPYNSSSSSSSGSFSLPFIDPTPHISSQFYTFNGESHALMIKCILEGRLATIEEIRAATSRSVLASWRNVWKDRNEDTAYLTAWKRIQDKLAASADPSPSLFFKTNAQQRVSHVDQWRDIVTEAHADPDLLRHLSLKDTMDRIRQSWTVGAKLYGIPESFVRVCVASCHICNAPSLPNAGSPGHPGGRNKRRRFEYTETLDVPAKDVPRRLQQLAAKHKVVLCIRQKYIRYKPFMAEVKDYACHRAGEPASASSGSAAASSGAGSTGKKAKVVKREPYQSKRCGCGFRIRAIVPITNYNEKDKTFVYQEEGTAVFKLYAVHSGHEPGPLDGSARIVHRLVGHKGAVEFDPDVYGVEENEPSFIVGDSHHLVMQQLQELKGEVNNLEGKVGKMQPEVVNPLVSELSDILQRIRKFNLDTSAYNADEALLLGPGTADVVTPWGTADSVNHTHHHHHQHLVERHEEDMIEDDDNDFGSSLGPIVQWDGLVGPSGSNCHRQQGQKLTDKWTMKEDVAEFDEKSMLNCGDDDDVGSTMVDESNKLIKQFNEEPIVSDPNLVGMQVEGFYHAAKWYESPPHGLDPGPGDLEFRHG
ncbi:hypothetical protein LUZ62_055847 [Rhynchospora pubera]|uniref:Uncharacterized protein n=1 Tax=Rhynchospora pubera TaxID=906938 RepID=A0AAV8DQU7_9POAL|nr:hypothetical protein LUZ62_055847 [Rhynchospora pubera]